MIKTSLTLDQLKLFISDFSERLITKENNLSFDQLFRIDTTPLRWFYRPILYSSLLPPPFPTMADLYHRRPLSPSKIALAAAVFKKYITINDFLKRKIAQKKRERRAQSNQSSEVKLGGKILFSTFTNYLRAESQGVFRLDSLLQQITRDQKYAPFLLVADPLSRLSPTTIYRAENTIYSYYDPEISRKAGQLAQQLQAHWQNIPPAQKEQALTDYQTEQHNYYPLLSPTLNFLYSREFIKLIAKWYFTMEKILIQEKVKLIVLTSQNNLLEKTIIAAAEKMEIPVFIVQHGLGLGTLPTIDAPKNVHFAVFSKKYSQELTQLGVRLQNIKITGPLIFDGIDKYIGPKREEERELSEQREINGSTEGKTKENKTILVATSPFVEDRFLTKEKYFPRVKNILQQLATITKNINLKLHPRERNRQEYVRMKEDLQLQGFISATVDRDLHYQRIQDCDLLVTFGSTVALEGMIIQRPILTIDLFDDHNPTNKIMINSGATMVIKYHQPLATVATALFHKNPYEKKAKQFVQGFCSTIDGKASQRLVEYIYQEIDIQKDKLRGSDNAIPRAMMKSGHK